MSREDIRKLVRDFVERTLKYFQNKISCPANQVTINYGKRCSIEVSKTSGGIDIRHDQREADRVRRHVEDLVHLIEVVVKGSIRQITVRREGDPIELVTSDGTVKL